MAYLILLRHGESLWNKKNLFTGWVDVPLSQNGIEEAQKAGKRIEEYQIDIVFSSTLIRAIMTATIALVSQDSAQKTPIIMHSKAQEESELYTLSTIYSQQALDESLPIYLADALNERMYGKLQGLNKKETAQRYGEEQVHIWRRSFRTPPPQGESLEMTMKRTLPYFQNTILPYLQSGKNVLIVAHGNSLRSIVKEIETIADDDIASYEIATGIPLVYTLSDTGYIRKVE